MNVQHRRNCHAVVAFAIFSSVFATETHAEFSEIVAFGASLTDTGNVAIASPAILGFSAPPSPPYYMGRFSNGPSWLEILADNLGVQRPMASLAGGTNYAWGGATTGSVDNSFGVDNVDVQVATYLGERVPTGGELFVIAGTSASNDFGEGQNNVDAPVEKLGRALSDLAAAGAKNVLVMSNIAPPGGPPLATQVNTALSSEIAAQRVANLGLTIYEFDADQVLVDVLSNPSEFGFTNVVDPACSDCGGGATPNPTNIAPNPDEFLFWDDAHFTAPFNEVLGSRAASVVPEPSAGPLFVLGLVAILGRRGTTKACPAGT